MSALRPCAAASEAGAHLALLKIRIVVPLIVVAVIAAIVAGNGAVPFNKIAILVLAGGLASAGAACLNHYLDRDIDAVMPRTKHRPIPSGRISNPATAALLGAVLIGVAVATALALNYMSLAFIALGAFFYVMVYTVWLKRNNPLNVVIGGFAGSCAALAGWTAIDTNVSLTPLVMALLVFLWTPSHFWSLAIVLRDEYHGAGIPMLPVLIGERRTAWVIFSNTAMTFLISLVPYYLGLFDLPYLVVATIAGLWTLRNRAQLLKTPTREVAWQNYKFSGVYLGLLFMGMVASVFL